MIIFIIAKKLRKDTHYKYKDCQITPLFMIYYVLFLI